MQNTACEFLHKCLISGDKRVGLFRVRSFSRHRRERASALREHEQPCLFVLRDWKWRRAETKTITCVCQRDYTVVESQRPPASDPRGYSRLTAAAGHESDAARSEFSERGLGLLSWLASRANRAGSLALASFKTCVTLTTQACLST